MQEEDCMALDALIRQLEAQAEAECASASPPECHGDMVQAMMDRYLRAA